jgi:hypothetical protein
MSHLSLMMALVGRVAGEADAFNETESSRFTALRGLGSGTGRA